MDPLLALLTVAGNIAVNVGSSKLYDMAKNAAFEPRALKAEFVSKAINAASKRYPEYEDLDAQLQQWVQSEALREFVIQVTADDAGGDFSSVVKNFVETTNFFSGNNTVGVAEEVLRFFISELQMLLQQEPEFKQDVLIEMARVILGEIRSMRAGAGSAVVLDDGIIVPESERELNCRIEAARSLIKGGNARAGLGLLAGLRDDARGKSVSTDLLFRIALYTAGAHFQLEQWTEAEKEYELATRLRPDNLKAQVNAAHFFVYRKMSGKALTYIEKAYATNPTDTLVRSVRLLVYHDLGRDQEVADDLASEDLADTIEGAETLGQIAFDKKDFACAVMNYQRVLDRDPRNLQAKILKAQALLCPIEEQFERGRSRHSQLSPEEQDSLLEAESLLSAAVEDLSKLEFGVLSARTRYLRAGVRLLLGKTDDAINDCESIPNNNSLYPFSRRYKSAILILQGKEEEGQRLLKELMREEPVRMDVVIPLADIYLGKKDFDEAVILLSALVQGIVPSENLHFAVIERLLLAYWHLGDSDKCDELIAQLKQVDDPSFKIQASAIEALHLLRLHEYDAADRLLVNAISKSDEPRRQEQLRRKLLYARAVSGELDNAWTTYEELCEPELAKGEISTFASELYGVGRLNDALVVLEAYRKKCGPAPGITEIEINILVSVGSFEDAKALLESLSNFAPQDYHLQLEMARLAWRLGQEDVCRSIVEKIDDAKLRQNPHALLELAYCWHSLNEMEKVLPLAYRARRVGIDDPDVHRAYADLVTRCADNLKLEEAVVDSTVSLKSSKDEVVHHTIVQKRDDCSDGSEIEFSDQLAKRLIGRKLGDKIVLREDQFGKEEYEVVALRHKYVTAYQDTLNTFMTRFPDESGIRAIHDPDFVHFFAEIERHHAAVSQVQELYTNRQIGFETASRLAGIHPVDFWFGTALGGGSIQAFEGTDEARQRQPVLIAESEELVIDLSGLLYVVQLGIEDALVALDKPILMSQFTFDELNLALFSQLDKPTLYAGKSGGKYTMEALNDESRYKRTDVIQAARAFVKSHVKLVGARKALESERSKIKEFYKVIGRGAYSSILLAADGNRCLLTDDIVLRSLLMDQHGKESACTYSLLVAMQNLNILSSEKFKDAVCALAMSGYRFLPVRAEDMIWPLEKTLGSIDRTAGVMINMMCDSVIEAAVAASVSAEFLRFVYFKVLIDERRPWIVQTLIRSLRRRRDGLRTLKLLRNSVAAAFGLMPLQAQEIYDEIAAVEATTNRTQR